MASLADLLNGLKTAYQNEAARWSRGPRLAQLLNQGIVNPNEYNAPAANALKDSLLGMLSAAPGVGDVASGVQAADYWNRGERLNAGLAGLGALPLVPSMAGIVSPSVAKGLNTVRRMPEDDIFRSAVENTPGAMLGESGLLMRLQRNQRPEQAMAPSVRGGVFYLPEGAAQSKYYSTGKSGYGGAEKITGETLISNPLFAKGGTGGKAPASAYDSLMGKGAYESMRSDALKSYGGFGTNQARKTQLVEEFLDNYAPELSDQAAYIVHNSRQGNQLAYALQEAAVGSAVRRAGHDAIVGYSKGKYGPFLSEIFDVRERSYPNKTGGYDIWEDFIKR